MLAVGAFLLGVTIVVTLFVAPIFRRTDAPAWAHRPLVCELVSVGIVAVLTLSLFYLSLGLLEAAAGRTTLLDLGALAAVVVLGGALVWRRRRGDDGARPIEP